MGDINSKADWWPKYFPERWYTAFGLPESLTVLSDDASIAYCTWEALSAGFGFQHQRERALFCDAEGISEDDLWTPPDTELLSDADKIRFCELWYPFMEEVDRYRREDGLHDNNFKWAVPICMVGQQTEVPQRWPYDSSLEMPLWPLCATCRAERMEWLIAHVHNLTPLQKFGKWLFGN
jgi:hypothetical protein